MKWRNLAFLHWPFDAEIVQPLLPDGLTADLFDGKVWVGLIPFQMEIKTPGGLPIPREGHFPETNVRTYVLGPDGTAGVYFFSLEAGRLLATAVARLSYALPYFWADMSVVNTGNTWSYTSRRKWPGDNKATSELTVEVVEDSLIEKQSEFERYLTARWRLYSVLLNRLIYAPVDHPEWPLQKAKVTDLKDELVEAAGLKLPSLDPIVHWTKGVEVRIGRPRRA